VLLSLCLCASLGARWEERLFPAPKGVLARDLPAGERHTSRCRAPCGKPPQSFQKIEESRGTITADYGFVNFNDDPLRVNFSIPSAELAAYRRGYGYTDAELDALRQWQQKALDDAYRQAVRSRHSQGELNAAAERIKADYRAKHRSFLESRGFALLPENVLVADIPGIVRRNVKGLRPVALSLDAAAQRRGYDSDATLSAAVSLVQTALLYDNVPLTIAGRHTGGVFPPLETMAKGKGDCDTKTALLAAILLNWDRMRLVGVGVPNHYLMGVLRHPARGDAFVEYEGLRYVLVEPAGPAWLPPGTISASTTDALRAGGGVRIEPFAAR
jgi:hypothetical protein